MTRDPLAAKLTGRPIYSRDVASRKLFGRDLRRSRLLGPSTRWRFGVDCPALDLGPCKSVFVVHDRTTGKRIVRFQRWIRHFVGGVGNSTFWKR